MPDVDIVAPNLVDNVWPQLADGFAASCEGSDLTPGHLWQECRSGHAFLVVAYESERVLGAVIVRFEYGADRAVLRGLALCGTGFKSWIEPMRSKLNEMAKQGGASVFVDEGRPALVRMIKGAKVVRVTYEVEVT